MINKIALLGAVLSVAACSQNLKNSERSARLAYAAGKSPAVETGNRLPSAAGAYDDALNVAHQNGLSNNFNTYKDSVLKIDEENYRNIVQFNHLLGYEFMRAADESRSLGKWANGLLIVTAVGYGIGKSNGATSSHLTNGLIAGLGLSEGIKYAGPNPSSLAFLAAAEQSACIASVGSAEQTPTDEHANVLWEIMTIVQADLRRNLTRKPIGLVGLATGLLDPTKFDDDGDYSLTRAEQRLRAHNRKADLKGHENTLKFKLLGCLTVITSGDKAT